MILKNSINLQHHKLLLRRIYLPTHELAFLTAENFSLFSTSGHGRFRKYAWLADYQENTPSCNGLLYFYNKSGGAAIWNPSTNQRLQLPSHAMPTTATLVTGAAFGFDSQSQDYRVVRSVAACMGTSSNHETGVELYSFRTNSWKWINNDIHRFYKPPVYINGRSYWLQSGGGGWQLISSFDFGSEELSCFSVPDRGKYFDRDFFALDLVEVDGRLGCIVYPRLGNPKRVFEVWVLDNGMKWSMAFNLGHLPYALRPMCLWRNVIIFQNSLWESDRPMLAYDLSTHDYYELRISDHYGSTMDFIPYVDSMLPIHAQLQIQN